MTTLDRLSPLGQWVADRPGRARVFERLGIDYCCGGRTPLADACATRGLDVGEILRQLRDVGAAADETDATDWRDCPLGELVDHIEETHHGYLRRELPRLSGLMARTTEAHKHRHPELLDLRDVFADLRSELDAHMLAEERVLFAAVRRLDSTPSRGEPPRERVHDLIALLEFEHDEAGAALARLRALTAGYSPPADACPTYRALLSGLAELEADLHRHVHEENNILFPRALVAEAGHVAWTGQPAGPSAAG
jgi:regulator of cell morphogenesis and NO signaling